MPASQAVRPFLRGAIILIVVASVGGGLYYAVSAGVTRLLGGPVAPAQVASEDSAKPPTNVPPVQLVMSPAAEAKNEVRPVLPKEIILVGNAKRIESPEGEYTVEPLSGDTVVQLRGKVKRLRIGSLDGDSTLEAEALEAQEIVFAGPVSGRAKARVNSPNGSVEFRGPISGQPRLGVSAPNGKVTFAKSAGGKAGADIDGEAKITIRAKEVDFQCPINGGETTVSVVFTSGGKMRFTEMGGRSLLLYRKADAKDPDPVIGWGIVRDDARCKETK
ncbi:MAG: hypothetical protein NT049_18385 [Planctomycetota bacterium]|nr:hypothetical protein [Planctomycetota bacterium]